MSIQFSRRFSRLKHIAIADRVRLKKQLQTLVHTNSKDRSRIQQWDQSLQQAEQKIRKKKESLPGCHFPEELPVSQKIDEIQELFLRHQVVIVAGHTGSGKTTQLPKMCLRAGRGLYGQIVHTQPRRLAAKSVAVRIAEELNTPLGDKVAYKVRFHEKSSEQSYIKLVTDGILLAEIQTDPLLLRYDTVIIDEAHERSLNIDFLLGYLKKLLPRRPDLKLLITSATINTEQFSRFFDQAPVIEVSGKTYPVKILYRQYTDANEQEVDINEAIVAAVNELFEHYPAGDILVFLSGEKEIREAHKQLKQQHFQDTEIIPLFARLSAQEQARIFAQHRGRRIILSTNIAETSLTVPGIRYVIDTGLAKISRYSIRSKIQRLPVEKISQASANQRSGRCGRTSAGVAIRLYSEQDFLLREPFTQSEILRTSLAQTILQMLLLKLGEIADFPLIDRPDNKQINDGILVLKQLQAIQTNKRGQLQLTRLGYQIAKISIDPRLARVIIEAEKLGVLTEIVVIVSALSCPDVRERPTNAQQAADEKHKQFQHKRSDFISYLILWRQLQYQRKHLSQNKLRRYCKEHFISWLKWREWQEIFSQIKRQLAELGISLPALRTYTQESPDTGDDYINIHRALLSGLQTSVARKEEDQSYIGCRHLQLSIHPGSALFKRSPAWILAAEVVETQKVYARIVAAIEPSWIEEQSQHLLKHHYYAPYWHNKKGIVLAKDKMTLYGLVVHHAKTVHYGPIDPQHAHEIFIKEALVTGTYTGFHGKIPAFIKHNQSLIEKIRHLEHKSRRQDILVDDLAIYEFYRKQIDRLIYSRPAFEKWLKFVQQKHKEVLYLTEEILKQHDAEHITEELYPPFLNMAGVEFALEYHFMPSHPLDGVTLIVPLELLNQVDPVKVQWLVPGLIRDKITLLFRSLPKKIRRYLVPIPERVTDFLEQADETDDLYQSMMNFLHSQLERHLGQNLQQYVNIEQLRQLPLEPHLKMNFRLLDENAQELDCSRNLQKLMEKWGNKARTKVKQSIAHPLQQENIDSWSFGDLPQSVEVSGAQGVRRILYPALVDRGNFVDLQLLDNENKARSLMYAGLSRLFELQLATDLKQFMQRSQVKKDIDKLCLLYAKLGNCQQLKLQISQALVRYLCRPDKFCWQQLEFDKRVGEARQQLPGQLEKLFELLHTILHQQEQLNKHLKGQMNLKLLQVYQQVRDQLSDLFHPQFIAQTPRPWLQRFPIYLQAINRRLQKAAMDPRRDQLYFRQYQDLKEKMLSRYPQIIKDSDSCQYLPELIEYRWLLEELGVSLFSQQLKTVQSVSVRRLEKIWQQISRSMP